MSGQRLPIAGVIKLEYFFTFSGGSIGSVVQHWSYTAQTGNGIPNPTDINEAATDIANNFASEIMPRLNGDVTFIGTKCTPLDNSSTPVGAHTVSVQGGQQEGTVPASAAVVQSFSIDTRWRGGRPKSYWPPMGFGDLTDACHWDATALGNLKTALIAQDTFIQSIGLTDLTFDQPGCVSYLYSIPDPNHPGKTIPNQVRMPPVFFQFFGTNLEALVGSQRRRVRSTGN